MFITYDIVVHQEYLGVLLDVLFDSSHVETDNGVKDLDVIALSLDEGNVWDGADAELASKRMAVVDVDLDEGDVGVLSSDLWKLLNEALAWAAPWGEEIDDNETGSPDNSALKIVIGIGTHEKKVAWMIRHFCK